MNKLKATGFNVQEN